MRIGLCFTVLTLSLSGAWNLAYGQGGEAGFAGGGSFYLNRTVSAPAGEAKVGFGPGFVASAWIGHNNHRYVGGEVRYTFGWNDMKLEAPGASKYTFGGRSHAFYYSLHLHTAPTESKVRPFFAAGGGVKGFQGTGTEVPDQPGQDIIILTKTSEWKPLIVFGGGIKIAVSDGMQFRVEVYDHFTQAPTNVVAPAPGVDFGGWFHNFTPQVGISFTF